MNKLTKNIIIGLLTSFVFALLWFYRNHIYYFFVRAYTPKTLKESNNLMIAGLHPLFAYRIARKVKQMESEGRDVNITSGYRSFEKQDQLYNSGQTPAKAGSSYHNYGMAIDINVDNLRLSSSVSDWQEIADFIQADTGFRWGGNFSSFYDPVHFDYGNKYTIDQLKSKYDNRETFQQIYPIV